MPVFLTLMICIFGYTQANQCKNIAPVKEPFAGLSACERQGLIVKIQWEREHPGWVVTRVRCTVGHPPPIDETT